MKDKIHILCPEYVPLENKGEEAIIRGTMDVVFLNPDNCEYHFVDNKISEYKFINGYHLHPGKLFFSDWRSREFGLGFSFNEIYSSICSLLRNFLNKFFPFWIKKPHKEAKNLKKYLQGSKKNPTKYSESINHLKKVNYVIAGHNGGLDEYVCHIVNELHTIGIKFGIFGSSMKPNVQQKSLLNVYEKTFSLSEFNIARNPIGYRWAMEKFPKINFELKPDPAFGMIPASDNVVDQIILKYDLTKFFEKPVIMVTTAEPAPISRHSFLNSYNKIEAHRKFLSNFFKLLAKDKNFNILFLPHTIGPNIRMDDRLISKDVIIRANLDKSINVKLLTADLSAKDLKGLISRAEFLIAERLHSIIGAIGVNTPFINFASDKDTRINGILKEQLNLNECIYSLSNPSDSGAYSFFLNLYNNRQNTIKKLQNINLKINEELLSSGKKIRKFIPNI